jgi:hypothetical protein
VPGGVADAAGVHGGTGCGGGGEDIVTAEVVAGQRSAEVGGGSGTGVDMLGGRAACSPSSLEVDVLDGEVVVRQSRAVVHRFAPCSFSPFVEHYIVRRAHTLCP